MKKLFTFSTLAALSLAAFGAQAQITVDGMLSPGELGTGPGQYQLVGTYTGAHSEADRGLKALYMATTATAVNFMVVASPEKTDYNALLLYLDMPNVSGISPGARFPGGSDATSQFRSHPTLDLQVDYGFRVTVSPLGDANAYHSKLDCTGTPTGAGTFSDIYLGSTDKLGNAFTVNDPASGVVDAKISYLTSASGSVAANTSTGWEIEYPLSALGGAMTNDLMHVFVAYVADNADFYSDVMPQVNGQLGPLGTDPNFTTFPGNQYYTYQVGVGPLAVRASAPELRGAVYPNPVAAASRLTYNVPGTPQPVAVDVYNSLGQKTLSLLNATQTAGNHEVSLAELKHLAAGTYMVTLRVGQQSSRHRVVVE
jgi:Secretion system C-terminal sorting domain